MATRRPTMLLILPRSEINGLHRVFGHRFVPLALMTVGALAEREGWDVTIVDETYDDLPDERPDLVGITVWTLFATRAYRIADAYRARGVPVVLGGVHASMLPGEALRHADAVVVGEAESALAQVLDDARHGTMAGIYRGTWGEMAATPTLDEMAHLYDRFPTWRYWPQYSVQTTRGCRFNCDYCSVIRINGRGARHHDPYQVIEQIKRRSEQTRLTVGVMFTDDDFGTDLEYTHDLLDAMVASKVKIAWTAQSSIGLARHPDLLALAYRAGCRFLFVGLESITRDSLLEANKKNRPTEYAELIGRIHDAGIAVEGAFIFGFDHDGPDVFTDTIEFADEIGVDMTLLNILTPTPGTATFARLWEAGRIVDFDWAHYCGYQAVFEPEQMSRAQLEEGLRRAYRDFYSAGRRRRRAVRHLRQFTPDIAAVLTGVNWSYGREFHDLRVSTEPAYRAPQEELERLAITSRADANEAIWLAAHQVDGAETEAGVPVLLGQRAAGAT
ncbi:MAG: radical SAM protein [Acidimicrobiales bacterium]